MWYLRVLSLVALLTLPTIAFAAAPRTFQELACRLVVILDNATIVLVVLAIVIYFYGTTTNLFKVKEEGSEKLKVYLSWGIIVLFVMISVWGILQLLRTTLFGNNNYTGTTTSVGCSQQVGGNVPAFGGGSQFSE